MEINQINDKRQPHGPWEYYYLDGRLKGKTNYKNGQLHGPSEWHNETGLWYKTNHKKGMLHGIWESYHANEIIMFKGNYKNGKQEGECLHG